MKQEGGEGRERGEEEEGVAGCETGRRGRETGEEKRKWKGRYKQRGVKLTLSPHSLRVVHTLAHRNAPSYKQR